MTFLCCNSWYLSTDMYININNLMSIGFFLVDGGVMVIFLCFLLFINFQL